MVILYFDIVVANLMTVLIVNRVVIHQSSIHQGCIVIKKGIRILDSMNLKKSIKSKNVSIPQERFD